MLSLWFSFKCFAYIWSCKNKEEVKIGKLDTKDVNDNLGDVFMNDIYNPGRWENIDNKLIV